LQRFLAGAAIDRAADPMALSVLIAAWLAGALGGAHCVTMCGGFAAAFASARNASANAVPLLSARRIALRQLVYNSGRISTYALLGVLAGGAGATAFAATGLLPIQRALYVVANLFLLMLAAMIVRRHEALVVLQHAGTALFARALPLVRPLTAADSAAGRYVVGMVWGLVPCALTYSVLPVALFAGGAWQGGAVMLAFGLGTLPNLLAAGWLIDRNAGRLSRPWIRWAAAALLTAFAVIGIWRAVAGSPLLAHGPFCL
jgi:uncharacterized protein